LIGAHAAHHVPRIEAVLDPPDLFAQETPPTLYPHSPDEVAILSAFTPTLV
jgi:hypothetical protein